MKYRCLYEGGPEVSEVGFGAWAIGGTWWGDADDAVSCAALAKYVERGGNFFDSARVYGHGRSERILGEFLRGLPPSERARMVFATKVPPKNLRWPGVGAAADAFPADWVIEQTEASLRETGLERLDLLQLHVWRPEWIRADGWREALSRLYTQGKIAASGVSLNDHDPASGVSLVLSRAVEAIQVIYNIFDPTPHHELVPAGASAGIGIIARCPFDEGSLTGKFTSGTKFPEGDFRAQYFAGDRLAQTLRRVEGLRRVAEESGWKGDLATLALRFVLDDPGIATVIPGIRTPAQAEANCAASDMPALPREIAGEMPRHAWARNFYA